MRGNASEEDAAHGSSSGPDQLDVGPFVRDQHRPDDEAHRDQTGREAAVSGVADGARWFPFGSRTRNSDRRSLRDGSPPHMRGTA
jgi:hypothetical protein